MMVQRHFKTKTPFYKIAITLVYMPPEFRLLTTNKMLIPFTRLSRISQRLPTNQSHAHAQSSEKGSYKSGPLRYYTSMARA